MDKGLTLIELLVVLLIMSLLTAVTIPIMSRYKVKVYNSVALSDIQSIISAQETYYVSNGKYVKSYKCNSQQVLRGKAILFVCSKDNYVISNGYNRPDYQYFSAYSCNGRGDKTYGYLSEEGRITDNNRTLKQCKNKFKRIYFKRKKYFK